MTQSKLVKKKKLTKLEKNKKNDKNEEVARIDKRLEAEINLKQMITAAHKFHKDHLVRSRKGNFTSNEELWKRRGVLHKDSVYSNHSKTAECKAKSLREIPEKSMVVEERKKKISNRIEPDGSLIKKKFPPRQKSSGKLRASKERAKPYDSTEFSHGIRVKVNRKRGEESGMTIKDYRMGKFVSLELLDKMKCHESDLYISTKKKELCYKKGLDNDSEKVQEIVHGNSGACIKNIKMKKTKLEEREKSNKIHHQLKNLPEKKRYRKSKRISSEMYKDLHSELIPISRESSFRKVQNQNHRDKPLSAVSNLKSVLSNMDSNISSNAGAGEPFSSNTSRSCISSDSDISKIDRKFMQILEAVTQNNIKIGFHKIQETINEAYDGTDITSADLGKHVDKLQINESRSIEMKIFERINLLEKKLENSRASVKKTTPENNLSGTEYSPKISNTPTVEIWVKENPGRKGNVSERELEEVNKEELLVKSFSELDKLNESQVEEICKSHGSIEIKDGSPKPVENSTRAIISVDLVKILPDITIQDADEENKTPKVEIREVNPKDGEETKPKTEEVGSNRNILLEPVETWSIIKRLEKAFQTLGLNLKDVENSDSSEEKKTTVRKQGSFGKGKTDGCKIETMKRIMEQNPGSSKKKPRKRTRIQEDIQYGVESNGSGDKNMEYKSVRPSKKMEDLIRMQKKVTDKIENVSFYASVNHTVPQKLTKGMKKEDARLSEGGLAEAITTSKRKTSLKREFQDRFIVPNTHVNSTVNSIDLNRKKPRRRYSKRLGNEHFDDIHIGRRSSDRESDYSISGSCSLSSLSEDNEFNVSKRKNNNPVIPKTTCHKLREKLVKIHTTGKGDSLPQDKTFAEDKHEGNIEDVLKSMQKRDHAPHIIVLNSIPLKGGKNYEVLKMEKEKDEMELKHIRERHKQIISEINTSLDEIKKQHNLYTKLRKQTKRFNKDYHAKRKLLSSYLKDVEESYERRKARHHFRGKKYRRALSSDRYYNKRNNSVKDKLSDYDKQMLRLKNKLHGNPLNRGGIYDDQSLFGTDEETSFDTGDCSSVILERTAAVIPPSDSAERSVLGVKSSTRTNQINNLERDKGRSDMLCLEWKKASECNSSEMVGGVPSYLTHLLKKLGKIILSEKNQLDNLVVMASGSSNNSSYSDKTGTSSTNSSGSKQSKNHNKTREDSDRMVITTGCKTSSTNTSDNASHRQHKCKVHGSKKSMVPDGPIDRDTGMSKSTAYLQGDPGGGSADSMEPNKIVISESHPVKNQLDTGGQSSITFSDLERRAEEFRYRKGDPSFSSRNQLLKCDTVHSGCSTKSKAEEEAHRRKIELEHILQVNEKNLKGNILFGRDISSTALDYDFHPGKGKHTSLNRHRQSIIIDHNRWEENEESQTVLGHASRHSGFGHRKRKSAHEYLKSEKKLGASQTHQPNRKSHDIWKKSGKKHHYEEVPVNYFEISLNAPGTSTIKSKDADCQTDVADDYDEVDDIYGLDESGSYN